MKRYAAAFIFLAFFLCGRGWAITCYAEFDVPSAFGIPLEGGRVLAIPQPHQEQAMEILGTKTFSPLTQEQVEMLFAPGRSPDTNAMLSVQAESAQRKAEVCRSMASAPEWANEKQRYLETAAAYEQYAAYTKSLRGALRPYLVKARIVRGGRDEYLAFLKGHRLRLKHRALGPGPDEKYTAAVIVYVEADHLDAVDVHYGGPA